MRLSLFILVLVSAVAVAQSAKDDDLSSAFGPPPPPKVFESERNVPLPPPPLDVNAELRATFETDLAAAQKSLNAGDAAGARDQLAMVEVSAIMLGGPDRVRVHKLQRAAATKLTDPKAIKETDDKWLTACGPNDVLACRTSALEAIAGYDRPRADKFRAADACVITAEKTPGKPPPGCVDAAQALYRKSEDTLMVTRIDLLRALTLAKERQSSAAKKALAKIAALVDDRSAWVRRTALETLSRIELEEGAVEAAVKSGILASEAWASALPPNKRAWARSPALDAACPAYDKLKAKGACRKLEKKLLSEYVFHDFSDEHNEEGHLISKDKLVQVNDHYGVMIQNCLAAEIKNLENKPAVVYRVKWLVIRNGQVDNFHSETAEHEQSEFVKCLRDQFGYWRYPRHEGDPQRITQSFSVKSTSKTWEEPEKAE